MNNKLTDDQKHKSETSGGTETEEVKRGRNRVLRGATKWAFRALIVVIILAVLSILWYFVAPDALYDLFGDEEDIALGELIGIILVGGFIFIILAALWGAFRALIKGALIAGGVVVDDEKEMEAEMEAFEKRMAEKKSTEEIIFEEAQRKFDERKNK